MDDGRWAFGKDAAAESRAAETAGLVAVGVTAGGKVVRQGRIDDGRRAGGKDTAAQGLSTCIAGGAGGAADSAVDLDDAGLDGQRPTRLREDATALGIEAGAGD